MSDKYDWLFRVYKEREDLEEKITKLHDYLRTARSVDDNDKEARELLFEQEKIMNRYLAILERRIEIGSAQMVADRRYMDDWFSHKNNGGINIR